MHIDWWTLGLQTVNVVILLWLLKRFLLKPVVSMIEARQAAVGKEMDAATAARAAAEAADADAERKLAAIDIERNARLQKAMDEVSAARAKALDAAHKEADALRAATQLELDKARQTQARSLEAKAGALALTLSERLLARLPAQARVESFLEPLLALISALPEESRALIAGAASVELLTATDMPADWGNVARQRIEALIGTPLPAFQLRTEPALLAGLELVTPHMTVRNSFRADLETIRTELQRHDN